jgi:predicted lipid-binding transport protein (Tim44 family)
MKFGAMILVLALALTSLQAEAGRRLGSGKSLGHQSTRVTQREATKAPAAPAPQNAAPAAPTPSPAPAPVAPAPSRPWGGMLGGLAAGLGLAWLAHSLGFGAEFGQFLMIAVFALVAFALVGMFMRRRQADTSQASPYAFEAAGAEASPNSLPQYNPRNVGNDSSARPVDTDPSYHPAQGSMIGSALGSAEATWGIPAGFDTAGFVQAAKDNFLTLQKAWDSADIATLRAMMTDGMLDEIKQQLAEREASSNGQVNHTDVVMLEAKLLGIEDLGVTHMASVEFSGMVREDLSAGPAPFREVWNLAKPKDGSNGWLVAGVQALQ